VLCEGGFKPQKAGKEGESEIYIEGNMGLLGRDLYHVGGVSFSMQVLVDEE